MTFDHIQSEVLCLAKEKIQTELEITGETPLEALLNSVTYIQFLIACEDNFGIEIDDDELDMQNFRTLNDVAANIHRTLSE